MKTFILATALLVSSSAFSAQYNCIAGRSENFTFTMKVEESQVTLKFKTATNPEIASDLNKKSVVLGLEVERSEEAKGWMIYSGNKLVNKLMDDYRHFELKINPETPAGSDELYGALALSPRGIEAWPSYFSQYDLNCKLIK